MSELNKRIAALSPEQRKQLLEKLKKKNGNAQQGTAIPRQSRDTNKFPLSFAQQRLWFLEQLEPGTSTWNIPLGFRMTGDLDEESLERALQKVVERHEVLRSYFSTENAQPVQVIMPTSNVSMTKTDLTHLPTKARNAEFRRLAFEEAQRPFDLSTGPLFRPALFRLDSDKYAFLLTMHHIISDAWSFAVFFKELRTFYNALCEGEDVNMPELGVQYADFSVWQRNWLQGDVLDKQLSYWKKHLEGSPSILQLPLDRPRPAVQTFPGAIIPFKTTKVLSDKIKALCKELGVTPFMVLITAFKTLLYRYTAQNDIVVGSPIAGRNRGESERLVGIFVNNMVLRTSFEGNPTFKELVEKVRNVALGAYEHQDLPFEKLVEEIHPDRDLSTSPLFQVMFILQNAPVEQLEFAGMKMRRLVSEYRTSRFDLTMYMADKQKRPKRFVGVMEYNTDLFDQETIRRMIGHFKMLLASIVENPERRIADLPIIPEEERELFLHQWNSSEVDYPREKCFYQLLEGQAERTPDAPALVFEKEILSYGELNSKSNQLACYLKELGVGPDVLVGICVERSVDMMVGLLAVMKSGGAYVPLDPAYPKDRIAYMLEDSKASVLLTQEALAEDVPEFAGKTVFLDKDRGTFSGQPDSNLPVSAAPENLAYVIYTSGSTGRPKGVAIEQRTLVNFLCTMAKEPGLSKNDVLMAVTTLSFDIAGLELYLPLLVGAKLVIASRDVSADGRKLASALEETGSTVMQATPATWRMLLESGWRGNTKLKILCGGEALPRELADRLLPLCQSLWNMYGPTETTIWSAVKQVEAEKEQIKIGGPIANTQLYILDKNLNPVPIGVYGELFIAGEGLARGYLHRPDLTAEKFVANPFATKPGERMYRTGDLTRFRPDGTIEFAGRIDHQVKVRGFRIELGEIEACLNDHDQIDQVVVVVREGESEEDKTLAAYMVPAGDIEPTVSDLRRFLMDSLPEYMIPTAFVFLEEFPLTPNGKVDRKALPSPEGFRPKLESEYVAPQNEVERRIAEVWQQVLQVEQVGVDDNFFDLGGHSLLLVQIQSKLSEAFKRDINIIDLFKYPKVSSLAKYLSSAGEDEQEDFDKFQDIAKKRREALARHKKLSNV